MTVSALRYSAAGKAVWGSAILTALFSMLLLPAAPLEASGRPPGNHRQAESAAVKQARAARIARRHAKLDLLLNDAAEDAINGQSNVIIEFNDETGADNLVKANGGKTKAKLARGTRHR